MLTDAELDALVVLVQRAGRGAVVDRAQLGDTLHELFSRVGLQVDDSETARLWHAAVSPRQRPCALKATFEAMAGSADPLAATWPTEAQALLNATMRQVWAQRCYRGVRPTSLAGERWASLPGEAQAEVLEQLKELARRAGQRVRRGAPAKMDQDTLLLGLAGIFVDLTGFAGDCRKLPDAQTSLFIRFCHHALRPYFSPTEVSPAALGRRWGRLKAGRPDRPMRRPARRVLRKRLIRKPF